MSIWAAMRATWALIFSDKGAMLLLFGAGLVYSFFYPLPYHYEQVEAVPTILVDQDNSASSRALSRLLFAAPALDIRKMSDDADAIQQALWHGDVMAMVVIPRGFHHDLLVGRSASVQVASHGGYLLAGSKALVSASQAAMTMGALVSIQKVQALGAGTQSALDSVHPVTLHSRALYNPKDGYGHAIVPAVMVLIIQQTLLIGVTLLLGRQAELQQVPRGWRNYVGMLLVFSTIALLNCLYFFVVAAQIQDYTQLGHFANLLVFSLLFSFCIAALALLLGRLFSHRERGLQLLLITSVPMLFVSGYSWPVEALPEVLQYLRWLLPTTAGIHGFVGINQLGGSLIDVSREFGMLTLLTLGMIAAGLRLYR